MNNPTKHFVNEAGQYVGAFAGIEPKGQAFEVPMEPGNSNAIWDFAAKNWIQPVVELSKQELLNSIIVTTQSGKTFDGHETARNNMMSAIMSAGNQVSTDWKLADNTKVNVTLDELKEALSLSIQAAGQIYLNS